MQTIAGNEAHFSRSHYGPDATVRVTLDSEMLAAIAGDQSLKAEVAKMLKCQNVVFDIDVALCQMYAPEERPLGFMLKKREELLLQLGQDTPIKREFFAQKMEYLYASSFYTFGLFNRILQAYSEVPAPQGFSMQQVLGRRLFKLNTAHNKDRGLYPDEFYSAAAQSLAFVTAAKLGGEVGQLQAQKSLINDAWVAQLWSAASFQLEGQKPEPAALLCGKASAVRLGLSNTPEKVLAEATGKEFAVEPLMDMFFVCLRNQLPVDATARDAQTLTEQIKAQQQVVDAKVLADNLKNSTTSHAHHFQVQQEHR